jgi:hypothetical protein
MVSNFTGGRTDPEAGRLTLAAGGLVVLFGFTVFFVAISP